MGGETLKNLINLQLLIVEFSISSINKSQRNNSEKIKRRQKCSSLILKKKTKCVSLNIIMLGRSKKYKTN